MDPVVAHTDATDTDRAHVRAAAGRLRASAYLQFFVPVTDRFARSVLASVPAGDGPVLDLGAGPGGLAAAVAATGRRCIAVDVDPVMLTGGHWDAVAGDATALPFRDAALDVVTAAFLLPHLDDPDVALREAARVLRPGGTLVLAGWADDTTSPFTGLAGSLLAHDGAPNVRAALEAAQERTASRWLAARVREAGFARVQVETVTTVVPIESPGRWWRGMIGASVGLSQLLHITELDVRRTVQERFLAAAERFRQGDTLTVPVGAHILRAIRP